MRRESCYLTPVTLVESERSRWWRWRRDWPLYRRPIAVCLAVGLPLSVSIICGFRIFGIETGIGLAIRILIAPMIVAAALGGLHAISLGGAKRWELDEQGIEVFGPPAARPVSLSWHDVVDLKCTGIPELSDHTLVTLLDRWGTRRTVAVQGSTEDVGSALDRLVSEGKVRRESTPTR